MLKYQHYHAKHSDIKHHDTKQYNAKHRHAKHSDARCVCIPILWFTFIIQSKNQR
jgi:hypothetical protein